MSTTSSEGKAASRTAPKNKTYPLPAEVVAAISTGRPEILTSFVRMLGTGDRVLTTETAAGLADLLKDIMADKIELQDKLDRALAANSEMVLQRQRAISILHGEEDE